MGYTKDKPRLVPPSEELRNTIQGWGVDLDPANRPSVPKEQYNPEATGARWDFPERQRETFPREKSPEHKFLTPVFGTSCPPKGLSGLIRRYAYRYSEGKTSHWLMLMFADRIDVMESRVGGLVTGHPDNPIAEAGLRAEITRHGVRSRVGRDRNDLPQQSVDYVMMATTYAAVGVALFMFGRAVTGAGSRAVRRM